MFSPEIIFVIIRRVASKCSPGFYTSAIVPSTLAKEADLPSAAMLCARVRLVWVIWICGPVDGNVELDEGDVKGWTHDGKLIVTYHMLWVSLLVVGDRGYRTWSTQAKRALYR
jgi:hypothetical protein